MHNDGECASIITPAAILAKRYPLLPLPPPPFFRAKNLYLATFISYLFDDAQGFRPVLVDVNLVEFSSKFSGFDTAAPLLHELDHDLTQNLGRHFDVGCANGFAEKITTTRTRARAAAIELGGEGGKTPKQATK